MKHQVIAARQAAFFGWPANNGLWRWDDGREILVGFVSGKRDTSAGFHSIQPPYRHELVRSLDGGQSWQLESPRPYLGDKHDAAQDEPRAVDFTYPDLALRIGGDGYHGAADPRGCWWFSLDRGRRWHGPRRFNRLEEAPELSEMRIFTPRTDLVVFSPSSCLFMLSARPDQTFTDRVFCARSDDGGLSFRFVAWVVPPSDPHRAVMPATVNCGGGRLVSCIRRRATPEDRCWIDAYVSEDGGASWSWCSQVGETGGANGNPPALARADDGSLVCVYGRRDRGQIVMRATRDEGCTWEDEIVLRAGFHDSRPDFGYPRLVRRADGRWMAFYYWATPELPEQHIAATVW
jgi:hypothetical protein